MSGYLESVLVLLAINTILAYAAFLPMVAGQLNLGVAAFEPDIHQAIRVGGGIDQRGHRGTAAQELVQRHRHGPASQSIEIGERHDLVPVWHRQCSVERVFDDGEGDDGETDADGHRQD